jgi:hypothetical protein
MNKRIFRKKNKEKRQVPKNFDDIISLAEYGYIYDAKVYPSEFKPKPTTLKVKWTRFAEQIIDNAFGRVPIGVKK